MSDFMDEAKKLASEHSDVADEGFDKAAETAEGKTGGRFDSQIEDAEQKGEEFMGVQDQDAQDQNQDTQGQNQ